VETDAREPCKLIGAESDKLLVVEKFYPELSPRLPQLLQRLRGLPVAVVGHARPDGDCIGSQVALARVMSALGHSVICVNADAVPRRLQFLAPEMTFLRTDEIVNDSTDYGVVFVDCADQARPGERLKARFPKVVGNIDQPAGQRIIGDLRDPRWNVFR
jgi:phosphoesterase RecJ-like protein